MYSSTLSAFAKLFYTIIIKENFMRTFSTILTVLFFLVGLSNTFAQGLEIKAEIIHGQTFTPPTLSFSEGAAVTLGKVELKGKWEGSTEPSPTQAWTWFQDTNDDCPQAILDWTNVILDTTWKDNGDGTFSIKQDLKNKYSNGSWPDLKIPAGWLSPDSVYMLELQSVVGGVATTLETFTFDTSGTVDFTAAEFKIKYEGSKDATGLTGAKSETMLKLENAARTIAMPNDIEFLRVTWMNETGAFYTLDFPVAIVTADELGLNIAITPAAYPTAGYFSAGDTIDVTVDFTNDGGTELLWDAGAANGLEKLEFFFSGPKQNYAYIYKKAKVIDKFTLKNDPATGLPFGNPIRLALPLDLPGLGTYTFLVKAKRIFGTTVEKIVLTDLQVGTTDVTALPVANCDGCHTGNSELSEHGAVGYKQCLVCHVDNMGAAFSKLGHEEHMTSPQFTTPLGSCVTCHVNDSQNQFTAYADVVCQACHDPVPFFPTDHAAAVPLYAETGTSCATLNCHSSGGLGVFKTISETHAGLAQKYVGGTLQAMATSTAPVLDGVVETTWNSAVSITTLKGVELKAMYDNDNIYVLAQWTDGHNLYGGSAAASESIDKNLWTHDTSWTKSGNEDRFGIMWSATDDLGASCAKMCHAGGEHKTSGGNVDVWHWKSARTNPVGLADDKWWSKDGRGSDASTVGAYSDNKDDAGTAPKYSGPVTDGHFIIVPLGGTTADLEMAVDVVNTYPGYILEENAAGSRWDVNAGGAYDNGVWTVEFMRPLDTGNADDVIFTHNSSIDFSTATFDNTGGGHASQGIDVGEYTLEIGDPIVSGIGNEVLNPLTYHLEQNYPNPFNPVSFISFGLKSRSHITIKVFNMLGQNVRTLANKELNAGTYKIQIDGTGLASGVYFYKLTVRDAKSSKIVYDNVKKMVLMK
jgi:hypothetical protein